MLNQVLIIGVGGGLGAMSRFLLSSWVHQRIGTQFPFGTLTANVLGCLAIGCLASLSHDRWHLDTHLYGLLIIGFLGAFTTFSTFTLETWRLFESGALLHASANILVSLLACFLGLSLGIGLAKVINGGLS